MFFEKKVFLIVFLSLFSFSCVKPVVIEGAAMSPTLNNGDKIILSEDIDKVDRGDIISFLYPKDPNKWFIKRVIGLPSETVEIKNGKVFIDDKLLDEPYIDKANNQSFANHKPIKVPEDHYFVLGDNRDNSSDSRLWGTVPKGLLKGVYLYKYDTAE